MSRKKIFGQCKLCGMSGQLSFEHVPPKAAFNNGKFHYQSTLDEIHKLEETELDFSHPSKYPTTRLRKKQGGVGYYSLCEKCNNDTGRWYAKDFIDWSVQTMTILLKTNGKPTLYYPTRFYPLRIIKQVLTMFYSVCMEGMDKKEPELQKFLLNKQERFLSKRYRVYCYYNLKGSMRYLADNFISEGNSSLITHASELSFAPFGFVFTINSAPSDKRLFDISHFAGFEYNHWNEFYHRFQVLPTYLPHSPLDYRTKDEVVSAIMSNRNAKIEDQ